MNTANSQQYQVHQIQFTKAERDQINRIGNRENALAEMPRYKAHLDASCFGSERFTPDMFRHWEHVCTIAATGLEDVFHIGNMGPEDKITRHASMHSLSVGDIVQLGGLYWMVEGCGFKEIDVNHVDTEALAAALEKIEADLAEASSIYEQHAATFIKGFLPGDWDEMLTEQQNLYLANNCHDHFKGMLGYQIDNAIRDAVMVTTERLELSKESK